MRIVHLSSEYPPQQVFGLGRYLHELSAAQAALGHEVFVVANSMGGEQHDTVRDGVRVCRVEFPPPPKAPATSAMLMHFNCQLIERCLGLFDDLLPHRADVINAHDWLTFSAAFHLGKLSALPVVTTIHDVIFNKVRTRPFSPEDAYVAGIENWACHASAKVIVLSETVRSEALERYHAPPEKVTVIPGGVGISPLGKKERKAAKQWRRQHQSDGSPLLLYTGRLDEEKGIPTLLSAVQRLASGPLADCRLLLAGSGKMEAQIKAHIHDAGLEERVHVLGYLDMAELRLAYSAADVVVVPSDYEPFGLVALEAQRLGTPVVVSDTGGLAETIAQTEGGLSFRPGDSAQLTERLHEILTQDKLRPKLGKRGQQRVRTRYAWPKIARRIVEVYEKAKDHGPPVNVRAPAWSPPGNAQVSRERAVAKPTQGQPLSDVGLLWTGPPSDLLAAVVSKLDKARSIRALNGRIILHSLNDAAVTEGIRQAMTPFPRVDVRHVDHLDELKSAQDDMAALVIMATDDVLIKQLRDGAWSEQIPLIWWGLQTELRSSDLAANEIQELYFLVSKLLCDESARQQLAPDCLRKIPQTSWEEADEDETVILHIVPQFVTGGAETTILDIVKGCSAGHRHEILSLGPLEGPLPEELEALGVHIQDLSSAHEWEVLDFIAKTRAHVLHLHSLSYVENWIPIHRQLSFANILESEHVVNIGSGHFGAVRTVACVSGAVERAHETYAHLMAKFNTQTRVVYNGIDLGQFADLPSADEAKRALGLPLDRPILGRVSALARNKLPPEALEAVPHVLKEIPDALFVIVGDGPERQAAEAWVAEHGLSESVRFLGERRDIPQVLCAFDVFAYYTTKEALGNVILEARAAGVPVVTTDVEGTAEAMGGLPDGLVKMGDYKAFARAIKDCLNRPAGTSPPATSMLPDQFTRLNMVRGYSEIYADIAGRKSPAQELTAPVPRETALPASPKGEADLLIKFPTRGRPAQFFSTLDRYYSLLSGSCSVRFLVSCDTDDDTMNCPQVRARLQSYHGLDVYFGASQTKMEAVNADLERVAEDYSVLLLASDDMVPVAPGYDDIIVGKLKRYFPSGDGVLFFNDGFRGNSLNTLVVMGKKYFDRFGYIYHPSYKSLWCDNEFTDVAYLLARQIYFNQIIIRHEHPLNVGSEPDELCQKNERLFHQDKETYLRRQQRMFGVSPRIVLSILTVTLESRRESYQRLHDKLSAQVAGLHLKRNIEILALCDNGEKSIGAKRNELMHMARGEYVCFVDDDDDLADDYVSVLYRVIADGSIDCVGISGLLIGPRGTVPKKFVHSTRYSDWYEADGVYYRPPNHLNPVRRSIALSATFPEVDEGEDKAYSKVLAESGLLKREVLIDRPLYYYFPHIFNRSDPVEVKRKSAANIVH